MHVYAYAGHLRQGQQLPPCLPYHACVCVCVCVCVYAYMHVTESERESARAWHVCKYLTSNVPIQQMRNLPAKAWLCPSVLLRHFESTCRVEP